MGRLILRRRSGEGLSLGDDIDIQVISADATGRQAYTIRFKVGEDITVDATKEGGHIKFTIEAPRSLTILRDELVRRPEVTSPGKAPAEPGPVGHPVN